MRPIVYLHGFNSSPDSKKTSALKRYLDSIGQGARYHCPKLAHRPAEAMADVEALIRRLGDAALIGSSLGGFYANHLAEKLGCRAVLVNPAVRADLLLAPYIGPQTNLYTGEQYVFTPQHIEELAALVPTKPLSVARYWLLVETGDETLDYRQAVAHYDGVRQTVIEGGDHGFQSWDRLLPDVVEWLSA
ncbi:MAG: YqiA/YcfP family alpha/beta fold hydrolase [Burkholderiales bacterium]|nr:YqiA/YcfP family alpha/beta fold hydrolase [Burkholderiales bacterium]